MKVEMNKPLKILSSPRGGGAYGLPMQEGSPNSEIVSGWLSVSSGPFEGGFKDPLLGSPDPCCQNPRVHPATPHLASEKMISSVQGVRGAGDI